MRAALIPGLFLASCAGPSTQTSPAHRGDRVLHLPYDCAGPNAYKCGGYRSWSGPHALHSEPEVKDELDAVEVAPLVYRIIVDNDWVRILSVKHTRGQALPRHTHPDRVVYDFATGEVNFYRAGLHDVGGVAPATSRELVVELGGRAGSPRPNGDEPVATYPRIFKLLLDEPPMRILDVTYGKGTSRPVALGDHVLLARDRGTLVMTSASGVSRSLDLVPGRVELFPAGVYTATNPKRESFAVVLVELKP